MAPVVGPRRRRYLTSVVLMDSWFGAVQVPDTAHPGLAEPSGNMAGLLELLGRDYGQRKVR